MAARELELAVLYAYNPPGVGEEAANVKAQVLDGAYSRSSSSIAQGRLHATRVPKAVSYCKNLHDPGRI